MTNKQNGDLIERIWRLERENGCLSGQVAAMAEAQANVLEHEEKMRARVAELERALGKLRNAAGQAHNVLSVYDPAAADKLDRVIMEAMRKSNET
jgi:hypothetical protein